MKAESTRYIGIDIGGAHFKCIGIDDNKNISYIKYEPYQIWNDKYALKEMLDQINNDIKNINSICGITMSAELCDNFSNRKNGARFIINACKTLKSKKIFFYNRLKTFSLKFKLEDIISMNWHAIGILCEKKIENSIIIDFGTTTTDFLCIKDFQLKNKNFFDFDRINNKELLYKGITRTPVFGIKDQVTLNNKSYKIIPELFSDTSDIFRVKNILNKNIDIDKTADSSDKSLKKSMTRIARSFGFDYTNSRKSFIMEVCDKLYLYQMEEIENYIKFLKKKYNLPKKFKIILSGVGQDILKNYFDLKLIDSIYLHELLNNKGYKQASYHAPALSIALLLLEKNRLDKLKSFSSDNLLRS